MRSKLLCATALLLTLSCPISGVAGARRHAAVDPEKRRLIAELLQVTGTMRIAQQSMFMMMTQMSQVNANIPAGFFDEFRKKAKLSELTEMLMPVYDKYYTKGDLRGLIAFYHSPLGRKVVDTMPKIAAESQRISMNWGRSKAEEVMRDLMKRNPRPRQ